LSETEVTGDTKCSVNDLFTIYAGNLIKHIFSSTSREGISFFRVKPLISGIAQRFRVGLGYHLIPGPLFKEGPHPGISPW